MFVWILVHHRGILTRILWETHEMQKEKKILKSGMTIFFVKMQCLF